MAFLIQLVALAIFLLPAVIAHRTGHQHARWILIANLVFAIPLVLGILGALGSGIAHVSLGGLPWLALMVWSISFTGPPQPEPLTPPSTRKPTTHTSKEARIGQLAQKRAAGEISEAEFQAGKAAILAEED